jgi:putative membrane protein|tara:strand:- start:10001 stop:10420 length:420 start_codon:yes stop_codon:yes gene_type:complete
MYYEIALIVHILAVISWMAGLFYLPRIMVYHAEQSKPGDKLDEVFQTMEVKLLRAIMLPAMIATLFSGIALVSFGVEGYWFYVKFVAVFFMFGFHGWLSKQRKNFIKGENKLTGKQLRIANEVPTLLLIIIVISVVIKF